MAKQTRVQEVADAIAFKIVSGKYAVGGNLPGVRKLASEYDVNPSTVQIILARLETDGFVKSRPGSGYSVIDIEQFGGIATWKYIFRFAQQIPDRAVRHYSEMLDFRTLVMVEALKRLAEDSKRYPVATVRKALEELELAMKISADDMVEVSRAQIHVLRSILIATEQAVLTSVINSISDVYLNVPAVMTSMTLRPEVQVDMWKMVIKEWEEGTVSLVKVERSAILLRSFDGMLLDHFRALVTSPKYNPNIPGSDAP